jgi:hypothetical protein
MALRMLSDDSYLTYLINVDVIQARVIKTK